MPFSSDVVAALGGLGLFLFGMSVMTDALRHLAGASLSSWLARSTKSPLSGAATGAMVTAVVQSSSATTVAAVGFVGAGLLTFEQSLGVLFGANLGTTVTGWMVALVGFKLDLGSIAPLLVFVGALIRLIGGRRVAAGGAVLAGFGLIFTGIDALQTAMAGFSVAVNPSDFPADSMGGRLRLLGVGFLVTLVTQSSSAGVATALTAVHAGAITFPQAAAMVIGMNVGTTATALLATVGAGVAARRTGYSHVVFNLITGVMAFFLLDPYAWAVEAAWPGAVGGSPDLALVGFHTFFNALGLMVVLPFTRPFARLVQRLVRSAGDGSEVILDHRLLETPAIALEAAAAATRRLARSVLRLTARGLRRPLSEDERHDAFEPLEREATLIRNYLAEVRTSRSDAPMHVAHVALIDALDHIFRLTERTGGREPHRRPGQDTSGLDAVIRGRAKELAGPLLVAALRMGDQGPHGSEEEGLWLDLMRAWEAQMDGANQLRARILRSAASRELSSELAVAYLEDTRRFVRIAYHARRIAA
ncbi:MAG: phosphate:Na+ symporter, partial [Planctomycetota bacterium]